MLPMLPMLASQFSSNMRGAGLPIVREREKNDLFYSLIGWLSGGRPSGDRVDLKVVRNSREILEISDFRPRETDLRLR